MLHGLNDSLGCICGSFQLYISIDPSPSLLEELTLSSRFFFFFPSNLPGTDLDFVDYNEPLCLNESFVLSSSWSF